MLRFLKDHFNISTGILWILSWTLCSIHREFLVESCSLFSWESPLESITNGPIRLSNRPGIYFAHAPMTIVQRVMPLYSISFAAIYFTHSFVCFSKICISNFQRIVFKKLCPWSGQSYQHKSKSSYNKGSIERNKTNFFLKVSYLTF